jgi:glucokinase
MSVGQRTAGLHLGLNIGGTNCSVALGRGGPDRIELLDRASFPTRETAQPGPTVDRLVSEARELAGGLGLDLRGIDAVGISCGGPLNSGAGLVLSPPNLPGWNSVPVVEEVGRVFSCPAALENDANASALAEWWWGAGAGLRELVFLTFGTGLGAGLILGGRLHRGACDLAGEVGHVRLHEDGPEGYGKSGSYEGLCSGGGIARAARMRGLDDVESAKEVFERAGRGDAACGEIVREAGSALGRCVALLVDVLNPEAVIVGGIYPRQEGVLAPLLRAGLEKEALPAAARACRVLPAALGDALGDHAALAVSCTALRGGDR